VLSAGELDELSRDVDVVRRVVDRLAAAGSYVIFVPAVAIELVLLAGMSESCACQQLGNTKYGNAILKKASIGKPLLNIKIPADRTETTYCSAPCDPPPWSKAAHPSSSSVSSA